MFQDHLLQQIQANLPDKASLNEAIAEALDIGYDAAHRRTSSKSKLSLEEGIKLAKYFNLSIDRLFEINNNNYVSVEKTKLVANEEELTSYYIKSYNSLMPLLAQKNCTVIYSAKDIPIFYTLENEFLSKFKAFIWLKLLDNNFKNVSFESYKPKKELIAAGKKLGTLYYNLNTTEIWDITTVNSILKQIHFYFSASLLSTDSSINLCKTVNQLIQKIEYKLQNNADNFLLYYNELLLMNNNVLIKTPHEQSHYVPFTVLSHYKTNDKITCNEAEEFLKKQFIHSKLLNTAGEKEQRIFFDKIYAKTNALSDLITATKELDFQ